MMRNTACTAFTIASIFLFATSLTQDCFFLEGTGPWLGILVFLLGWAAVIQGVVAWLANPALFVVWILMFASLKRVAVGFAFAALVLSLSFLLQNELAASLAHDHPSQITGYGLGYLLWVGSIVAALTGGIVGMLAERIENRLDLFKENWDHV